MPTLVALADKLLIEQVNSKKKKSNTCPNSRKETKEIKYISNSNHSKRT
jgi:hypothetical protein